MCVCGGGVTPAAARRDGRVRRVVGLHNEQCPLLPMAHISLKCLVDGEMKLVYGDEQNITHNSPASTSLQLMCHGSETGSPPCGPNLSELPGIDK